MFNVLHPLSSRRLLVAAAWLALSGTAFTVLIHPGSALSQTTSGDLTGTIKDASGGAIPNATVVVRSEKTGVAVTVSSNAGGQYFVPNLLPAAYDITASANGFTSSSVKGVLITLNMTGTQDLQLGVGAAATTVEVTATAGALLDTTSQNLTQSFTNQTLSFLPTATLGSSNYGVLNASLLSPGVTSAGGLNMGAGPSVGGQRPRNNNYTLEGIDNNNKAVTGPLVYVPNDAVSDFTLITNQFSPEFGHSSGGQFNQNVLSGGNQYHGRVYEYFQNRNLNAANAVAGGKSPNLRYDYNRYGGQFGGPLQHDKLFFFANFERSTQGQAPGTFLCTPTAAGMTALSGLIGPYGLNANNVNQFIRNVPAANFNGGAQVTDANDLACFNQSSGPQALLVYPGTGKASSTPYSGNDEGPVYGSGTPTAIPLGNYYVSNSYFINYNALTTSGDWNISDKDSLRLRYVYNKETELDYGAYLPAFWLPEPYRYHLVTLSEFHNFTPNLTNELRIGYNRYLNSISSGNFSYPGLDSFPNLTYYDLGGINVGPDQSAPQSTIQNLYQLVDNVSYTRGRHTIKLGFDGRKYISPQTFIQRQRGDYEWDYATEFFHDLSPTAFGERSTGNFTYYGDQTAFYGYGNDTWRITHNFTLNYGLRYEFTSIPAGEKVQSANAIANAPGLITFGTPQPAKTNFAPRVGINYSPDRNTSFRAGYGLAYDVLFDNLGTLSVPPQYSQTNDVDPTAPQPGFLSVNHGLNNVPAGFSTQADARAATSAYIPDQIVPYAETWDVQVQHTFFKNYVASIGYEGNRGIHLPVQDQINIRPRVTAANQLFTDLNPADAVDPGVGYSYRASAPNANNLAAIEGISNIVPAYEAAGFTNIVTAYEPYSFSNYHALLANLQRNYRNGLQLNLSYTWSKTMDDATPETFATIFSPRRPQDSQCVACDYSRSALDHTHRVTLEAVYDLPFFKHSNYLLKNVVGNWVFSPIYTYESPEYVTALSGVNSNLNGDSGTYIDRPLANPGGNKALGDSVFPVYSTTLSGNCDPSSSAFVAGYYQCDNNLIGYTLSNVHPNAYYIQAAAGVLPNVGRNTIPARPTDNLDMSATKRISFTERYSVEFQAQAFNLFNHAQYTPGSVNSITPNIMASQLSTAFQTVTSSKFQNAGAEFMANARTLQLSAKLNF